MPTDFSNDMDQRAFGHRVQVARIEAGLSVIELADKIGITDVFVRHIEAGRRLPSLPVFIELCNTLRIAPSYFWPEDLDLELEDPVQMAINVISGCSPRESAMIIEMIGAARKHLQKNIGETKK